MLNAEMELSPGGPGQEIGSSFAKSCYGGQGPSTVRHSSLQARIRTSIEEATGTSYTGRNPGEIERRDHLTGQTACVSEFYTDCIIIVGNHNR